MTTKKTRREFTDEFKREAVVLLRDSGRPLTQVASELGLEPSVLRRWRSLANGTEQVASAVRPGGAAAPATSQADLCAPSWTLPEHRKTTRVAATG